MINVFYLGRSRATTERIRCWKDARLVRAAQKPMTFLDILRDPHEPRPDVIVVDENLGMSVGGVDITGSLILRRADKIVTDDVTFVLVVGSEQYNSDVWKEVKSGLSEARRLSLVPGGM